MQEDSRAESLLGSRHDHDGPWKPPCVHDVGNLRRKALNDLGVVVRRCGGRMSSILMRCFLGLAKPIYMSYRTSL